MKESSRRFNWWLPDMEKSSWRLFVFFLLCGLSIGAAALLISNVLIQFLGLMVFAGLLLVAAVIAKRSPRFERFWEVFFAFFVLAFVQVIRTLSVGLVGLVVPSSSVSGQALIPVTDALATILPILVLTMASGRSLASIYLKRGNLRLGLKIGLPAFFFLYAASLIVYQLAVGNSSNGITFAKLLSLTPLLTVAIFLNAPKEELFFRGLFLRKYEPLLGKRKSNLLQAPLFALAHIIPQYAQFGILFLISFLLLVFALGLVWGYIIQKTDSLLGSSLFHAGADVAVYLAIILPPT